MHMSQESLTHREQEVLTLVAEGLGNKQIARALDPPCRPETVKAHLRDIYAKLGVGNRTEAAMAWQRLGGEQ
jgi:DNA-binding NarL/FixJ family response regulator